MGLTTAEAQVEKKCYKNQTAGWLGVVKLDHLGAQVGHSIEPYGTVWLSDDEAKLTARAPARPEDNPFVEKIFQFYDGTGAIVEEPMRQLVLSEDGERYNPASERYVPGEEPVVEAAQRDAEAALAAPAREVPTEASAPALVPSSSAAVPPSHTRPGAPPSHTPAEPEEDVRQSWTDTAERTLEPQEGSLRGSNDGAPGPVEGEPKVEAKAPPQKPAPEPIVAGESRIVLDGVDTPIEEHAGVTKTGEETGAADVPTGDAPEGEFAAHEEVGSPDAPTQGEAS